MKINIRILYLYLFSFIGLVIIVMSSIKMIDLTLKTLVFKDADKYEYYSPKPITTDGKTEPSYEEDLAESRRIADQEQKRLRQREFSNSIAMLIIGLPLYVYHWKQINKENLALGASNTNV